MKKYIPKFLHQRFCKHEWVPGKVAQEVKRLCSKCDKLEFICKQHAYGPESAIYRPNNYCTCPNKPAPPIFIPDK